MIAATLMKDAIDFDSPTWAALHERAATRLALLRRKNDGELSVEATARLRGQIAELKDFLALATPLDPDDVANEP